MFRTAKTLERYDLYARDGKIGHVEDFFFDDERWTIRYFVVEGADWLTRKVLISPASVTLSEWEQRVLRVNLTRQQVEQSPAVDTQQPVSREHEAALTQYYNWPVYWGAAGFPDAGFGVPMVPLGFPGSAGPDDPTLATRTARKAPPSGVVHEDYHLRSVRAVTGDVIEAIDGSLGHVDDFLIEDGTWAIRYLVIDTRNWWPGKKVLIATSWIEDVGWKQAKVRVGLTREEIKSSPAFDPEKPLAREYLDELHRHYGKPEAGAP